MSKRGTWLALALLVLAVGVVAVWVLPAWAGPPINCRFVPCPYPDCLPGEHTEIPPGQCCPVCVPD